MRQEELVWIFGYGSLLGRRPYSATADGAHSAVLRGYRRRWDVAMDNSRRIPGYKAFVDPDSGEQPSVFVTFLNIQPDPAAWINGALIPVPESELPAIDARERNYHRRDVTALVESESDIDAPVWAYVGTGKGRARYRTGRASGSAVVSTDYLERVEADFASFGDRMLSTFWRTTDPPEVPVARLERIELEPAA